MKKAKETEQVVNPPIPPEILAQAQARVQRDRKAERVNGMILEILKREGCSIQVSVTFDSTAGTQYGWRVVPNL